MIFSVFGAKIESKEKILPSARERKESLKKEYFFLYLKKVSQSKNFIILSFFNRNCGLMKQTSDLLDDNRYKEEKKNK